MRWLLFLPALMLGCPSGPTTPRASAGIPVVPDAIIDVAFGDLTAFADALAGLARSGLGPAELAMLSQSGLEAAGVGAPVVVAVREGGEVVVAARLLDSIHFQAALATALPRSFHRERRLGHVDAIIDDDGEVAALVRADGDLVLIAASPTDPWGAAALIEALAVGSISVDRRVPQTTEISTGRALRRRFEGLDELKGTLQLQDNNVTLSLRARTSGELQAVLQDALSSSSPPPFACAVDDSAAISLTLPALGASALANLVDADPGQLDAFDGALLVALHEPPPNTPVLAHDKATWASLVVAGRPRAGGAPTLRQTLAQAGPSLVRSVGGRQVTDLSMATKPWRQLSAVVDDDLFALAVGATTVVDRVAVAGSCAPTPGRLLLVNGPRLLRILGRAAPELSLLLGVDRALLPTAVQALAATERLEVSAWIVEPDSVQIGVALRLRSPSAP